MTLKQIQDYFIQHYPTRIILSSPDVLFVNTDKGPIHISSEMSPVSGHNMLKFRLLSCLGNRVEIYDVHMYNREDICIVEGELHVAIRHVSTKPIF